MLIAKRDVHIGFDEPDPEDPRKKLVVFYEAGEEIVREPEEIANLEGLIAAGWLERVKGD